MKQFSADYFKKKYQTLSDRLTAKEGFQDDIKRVRMELKIPADGYQNSTDFAYHIVKDIISNTELQNLDMLFFFFDYENKQEKYLTEGDREKAVKAYMKKGKLDPIRVTFGFDNTIQNHHSLFVSDHIFKDCKKLAKYSKPVNDLMNRYWNIDLLEPEIIFHFIEKYLFMGKNGIDMYISRKVSCHNCKYLGIEHFSPDRHNMIDNGAGPYEENYLFNEQAVARLSKYFNSVFIIIKPYATKDMVIQYIEENWNDLKGHIITKNPFYKQLDVKPSRIKESDTERNKLVYELNKNSKKELLNIYKGEKDFSQKGIYKESIISAILKENYGIYMTNDAIKKTAHRYGKSIENRKQPKDIRDI